MSKTFGQMATELQRRITQLNATDALAALNRAWSWTWRQGSYTFQLTGSWTSTPLFPLVPDGPDIGSTELPSDCDLSKAIFVVNSPQGTPIEKRPLQDFSLSFALNVPANQGFHVYTLSGRTLLLRPSQVSQEVGVRYHVMFSDKGTSDTTEAPADYDEALIRLAEAEERRIYDVGSAWPKDREAAEKDALQLLSTMRSTSQENMSAADAASAIAEKTQAGRA